MQLTLWRSLFTTSVSPDWRGSLLVSGAGTLPALPHRRRRQHRHGFTNRAAQNEGERCLASEANTAAVPING